MSLTQSKSSTGSGSGAGAGSDLAGSSEVVFPFAFFPFLVPKDQSSSAGGGPSLFTSTLGGSTSCFLPPLVFFPALPHELLIRCRVSMGYFKDSIRVAESPMIQVQKETPGQRTDISEVPEIQWERTKNHTIYSPPFVFHWSLFHSRCCFFLGGGLLV